MPYQDFVPAGGDQGPTSGSGFSDFVRDPEPVKQPQEQPKEQPKQSEPAKPTSK